MPVTAPLDERAAFPLNHSGKKPVPSSGLLHALHRAPTVCWGGLFLVLMVLVALLSGWLADVPPTLINIEKRLSPPSWGLWFGSDLAGRSIWSRTLIGGRISLVVGLAVATLAIVIGLVIGLAAGYSRLLDQSLMRVMDGMMAIPSVLLAIAMMTLFHNSVRNIIIAIAIPEIPRVARLVRAVVLSVREMAFVEAATAAGVGPLRILFRHILPGTVAPLTVLATYVTGNAILNEAYLSFLGAGTPSEIPSWGNIIAEGRVYFSIAPWTVLIPSAFVGCTILAINVLGDGLRDLFDPKAVKRL